MASVPTTVTPYEERLRRDRNWAMDEGDRHIQSEGAVFKALREIARRLEDRGISYAVAGAMALDAHGFRRLTVVVDILVTRESLRRIHDELGGLGYVPPFIGSKNLRDTEHGVRIEFLIAGEFPGDGKPKPVAFPDPADVATDIAGVKYVSLRAVVEMKLASGMSNPGRLKDLGDVQELIRALPLSREFANELDPSVQRTYLELWDAVSANPNEL